MWEVDKNSENALGIFPNGRYLKCFLSSLLNSIFLKINLVFSPGKLVLCKSERYRGTTQGLKVPVDSSLSNGMQRN